MKEATMDFPGKAPAVPRLPRQAGVGLTEVMVSLLLGLLVTAAVVQIYVSGHRNRNLQESVTAQQEAARYAAGIIQADAQLAGFRGCLRDVGNVQNTLNNAADFRYDFARPVQGFDATGAGSWTPALPAFLAAANPVSGTDVLTVRAAEDPGIFLTAAMPSSISPMSTVGDLPEGILEVGDLALVSDCGGSAIFQVSSLDLEAGVIDHQTGGASPGNATSDLGRRFTAGAQIFRLQTTSYFIAPSSDDTDETNRRSLWRQVGDQDPQELAQGIENLQVLYGEDTDGDQSPDEFRTAANVADWRNVVSLRVALLASGSRDAVVEEDTREFDLLGASAGPFDDGRLRRVVTFSVALRNRLS
jgi:type IV pilus assembly protein PilW